MLRAGVKSSFHHMKMDNLSFLWDLLFILIQILFLLMFLWVQPRTPFQRNHSELGYVPLVILLALVSQSGRNTLQVMHWIYQNHKGALNDKVKGKKIIVRYLVHSCRVKLRKNLSLLLIFGAGVQLLKNMSCYMLAS